ncbi:glycoside hydrolase family 43 protein [Streptomyces sp. 4N509B]|uniref:glycoside hydrolase family 43 protein n=1 Tax=Streptomyces sp. 4N509B TaxID=3457413 RepID=UPI003FCF8D0A
MSLSRRRFGQAVVASAAVGAGVASLPRAAAAATAQGNTAYLMSYFTESPNFDGADYGLHLAVSRDGLNWTPLNQNNPVATPTEGTRGLRDPFVFRTNDGTFVVLATDLRGTDFSLSSQYLHVWDSTDLTELTGYRRLRMHTMTDTHTWAPTAFWDAARGAYGIVYSANTDDGDVFLVNHTSDFRTVSPPQVFFSPGFPVLDGDVVVDGSTTYLYYKNLSDGRTYGARSATGAPNSFTTYTGGLLQGNAMEAPLLLRTNEGGWRLWADSFSPVNAVYYAWRTTNISGDGWTPLNQRDYTPPLNAKHGSMVGITDAEYDALVARWGLPGWVRLKSFNFPDRFVRHADFTARLDAYPFDPYQDQMWRMVPGLADPSGVSFESLNYPDHYLRQLDSVVRLDPDDGSGGLRADATFHQTPGLADASWSSFRSHADATRYLRHSGYVLRVDPVGGSSSATDRQDATFRVTP